MGHGVARLISADGHNFFIYRSVWLLAHFAVATHEHDLRSAVGLGDESIYHREPPQRCVRTADDDDPQNKDHRLQPVEWPETPFTMTSADDAVSIFLSDSTHNITKQPNLTNRSNHQTINIHFLQNNKHILQHYDIVLNNALIQIQSAHSDWSDC